MVSKLHFLACVIRQWPLIWELTKRELVGRYRGSVLGILWSFFYPLLLLSVYSFVFGDILAVRWNQQPEQTTTGFALVLFAGLIAFNFYAECVNRAPTLVLENVAYVKKVVFPLEILPWVSVVSALLHTFASFIVLVAFILLVGESLVGTIPLALIALLPLLFLVLALQWVLSSLGVYLRDIHQIVGVVTTAMMFLCPIFYPLEVVPLEMRWLIELNPLTSVIENFRSLALWGKFPDLELFSYQLVGSVFLAWLGFLWFQKTRKGFADVL